MVVYFNLEIELKRRNMTKRELADKTGIRYNTLIDKLNNKFGFSLNEAITVSSALNNPMPIEELFATK